MKNIKISVRESKDHVLCGSILNKNIQNMMIFFYHWVKGVDGLQKIGSF